MSKSRAFAILVMVVCAIALGREGVGSVIRLMEAITASRPR